jgi:hypothetical protein
MSTDVLSDTAVTPDALGRRGRHGAMLVAVVIGVVLLVTAIARLAGDRALDQSARDHHALLADTVGVSLNTEASRQLNLPVAQRSSDVLVATGHLGWPDPLGPSSSTNIVGWDVDRIAVTTTVVSDGLTTTELIRVSRVHPTDQSVMRCVVASDVLAPTCAAEDLALLG